MADTPDTRAVAVALQTSVSMLLHTLRRVREPGVLSLSETAVMAHLEVRGPTTASALARAVQISPQSMGATVAALRERGFVRGEPDPGDGRRTLLSATREGLAALHTDRGVRTDLLTRGLAEGFTDDELARLGEAAPLIRRLAQRL